MAVFIWLRSRSSLDAYNGSAVEGAHRTPRSSLGSDEAGGAAWCATCLPPEEVHLKGHLWVRTRYGLEGGVPLPAVLVRTWAAEAPAGRP